VGSAIAPDLRVGLGPQTAEGITDVILGKANPSGRLPFTIPSADDQLPAITDYSMTAGPSTTALAAACLATPADLTCWLLCSGPGRTYRYLNYTAAPPLLPFGFGLSFSTFTVEPVLEITPEYVTASAPGFTVQTVVANSGPYPGMHALALYGSLNHSLPYLPRRQLLGIKKVTLLDEEKAQVSLKVSKEELEIMGIDRVALPATLHLWIGDALDGVAHGELAIRSTS
jgi:beta-glucosidase